MTNILFADCMGFLCTVGLLLLVIAIYRRNLNPIILGGFLLCAFCWDSVVLLLPRFFFFATLHWNWQGKILEFLWPLVVVYLFQWFSPNEVGLCLPKKTIIFFQVGLLAIVIDLLRVLAIMILSNHDIPSSQELNLEGILYQFTMPGLAEEIVYRGICWAIINRYLKHQWSLILTSILFTVVHVITYDRMTQAIGVSWLGLYVLPIGIILGLIREKSSSIWPGVLFHNLYNGTFFLLALLLSF